MSKSIAVFGAGPGLGQAVARRYAREGYAVTLVARRPEPLDRLADKLTSSGATAHVVTADLADTGAVPRLAERIRAQVGELDALYYAPTPSTGFVPAANLTPQHAESFMPLILYTMLELVQEFLPHMIEQGDGAILTAQGGSTVRGLPNMSGPSPAQAAQRNYLQALHAEVAEKGVYVGMLYVGAAIESSAFHTEMEQAKAAGEQVWEMPTVNPEYLAGLLWTMHAAKGQAEVIYPDLCSRCHIRTCALVGSPGRASNANDPITSIPEMTAVTLGNAMPEISSSAPITRKMSRWRARTTCVTRLNSRYQRCNRIPAAPIHWKALTCCFNRTLFRFA
jgi:short-subunit dehydrogenase